VYVDSSGGGISAVHHFFPRTQGKMRSGKKILTPNKKIMKSFTTRYKWKGEGKYGKLIAMSREVFKNW
jgi:hypothetical protein